MRELDERARAVAASLQEMGEAGDRALVIYAAGLDFLVGFFGCLYAGMIGIPTPPPEASRLKRTRPRLQSIANDAQARLVLTTAAIRELLEQSGPVDLHGAATAVADHRRRRFRRSRPVARTRIGGQRPGLLAVHVRFHRRPQGSDDRPSELAVLC